MTFDQGEFKGRIARIQWNNRIASNLLLLWFFAAVAIFCIVLVVPFVAVFAAFDHQSLTDLVHDPSLQRRMIYVCGKVFFFTLLSVVYFIHRDFEQIGESFNARPLTLKATDPFRKKLEELCISRGLNMPDLLLFTTPGVGHMVTAAVVQGTRRRSKAILTQADLSLPPHLQEALAAQIVQRLYTRDALFLTLLCFMGNFPYHMRQNSNPIARFILKPALLVTDAVLSPFRRMILNLRLAKLDVGSLELTKQKSPAQELLARLSAMQALQTYFHDPYLALFIAQTDGPYRPRMLEIS